MTGPARSRTATVSAVASEGSRFGVHRPGGRANACPATRCLGLAPEQSRTRAGSQEARPAHPAPAAGDACHHAPMSEHTPLVPGHALHTSADAIRERAGLLDPAPEQSEAFWREHEPHMLPPDDEP
jgi:hypothetical protein